MYIIYDEKSSAVHKYRGRRGTTVSRIIKPCYGMKQA